MARVSRESIFSDLNNLVIITTTSNLYETAFGFIEQEVFDSLDEFGLSDKKDNIKAWYDGFTFGDKKDIYNPWSIINYLKFKKFTTYWADSSELVAPTDASAFSPRNCPTILVSARL